LEKFDKKEENYMPCFYTPDLKKEDKKINLSGDEFHHIAHVFRKTVNDEIALTNGKGILAKAKISFLTKRFLTLKIISSSEERQSNPKIAVAFSLLRNKNDFLIVEKLTELGVKDFFPLITERSVRKPSANTIEKFRKVAISAIKQCDNAFLPKIHQALSLETFLASKKHFQPVVALEIGKHKTIVETVRDLENPVCIIIGPEGGFSEREIELFKEKEIPAFSLGNHILRAETAAIASVSQLLGFYLQKNPHYY